MNFLKISLVSAILSATLFAVDFELDKSHSAVGFSVKHLMVSNVKGKFNNFDGNFSFDAKTKKHIIQQIGKTNLFQYSTCCR